MFETDKRNVPLSFLFVVVSPAFSALFLVSSVPLLVSGVQLPPLFLSFSVLCTGSSIKTIEMIIMCNSENQRTFLLSFGLAHPTFPASPFHAQQPVPQTLQLRQ
jgi:hypothetical protein